MLAEKFPNVLALEDAHRHLGQGVHGMIQLAEHQALQARKVAGQQEVEHLPVNARG